MTGRVLHLMPRKGRNLCGVGGEFTFLETAKDTTPAAFVMPYAWEDVAICVQCARKARADGRV